MNRTFFVCLFLITFLIYTSQAQVTRMKKEQTPEEVVRAFLQIVRSGKEPERASEFMADTVIANQMNAENEEVIKRIPANYTEHIHEFLTRYGNYSFELTELIANDKKVYVRWKQSGIHMADIDQHQASGLPLTEIGSAVYRIERGKIAEYWVQLDRQGLDLQLQKNENKIRISSNRKLTRLPFTDAVSSGETIYISGQIGTDESGSRLINTNFNIEANQAMKNIGSVLQRQSLTYNDLLSVTIYLTTMDNYAATNEVYQKYFDDYFPARVCIAVKELPLNSRIEIAAIAKRKIK